MCLSPRGGPVKWLGALAVVVSLGVAGCGEGKGTVSGKVTYKGVALKGGRVTYTSAKGKSNQAEIGEDGSYTVEDLPSGPAKITVQTSYLQQMARAPRYKVPEGAPEGYKGGGDPTAAKRYVKIPDSYEDLETSGLTYDVKKGAQTHDIPLQ
jgi:hypothetical protein